MKAIVFDLDGTLADTSHRDHHLFEGGTNKRKNPDWDAYYEACGNDKCIEPIRELVKAFNTSTELYWVLIVTGRPERTRRKTQRWLHRYEIGYNHLFMRSDTDRRKNADYKVAQIPDIQDHGYEIILWVEDNKFAANALRGHGITVLEVLFNGQYSIAY